MSYQHALEAIQAGQFEAAIAELEPLLQADPNSPKLWYAKALALLSGGNPEMAVMAAQQAIQLNPDMAPAHRLLASAYSSQGKGEPAIAAYKQATRCYLSQQDKANAQACITAIEQLTHSQSTTQALASPQSFLTLVTTKIDQGRYSEALQDLNWLLNLDANNAMALAQRGMLHARLHNPQAAAQDLARSLQLAPSDPALQLQQNQIRLLLGDAYGAVSDLSALLKTATGSSSQAYALRGQAYQQMRDFDNAFKDFSNALGIDPSNAECYRARGEVYESMGELTEALANYRQAAALYLNAGNGFSHQALQGQIRSLESKLTVQKHEADRTLRIPIKDFSGGSPVLEVTFNGFCPCNMILDTGASMTMITQQIAQLLRIVPVGNRWFRLADGRAMQAPVGFVQSVAVDQARADNLEVAITATDMGLLGQNFLWRYDVRILSREVELYLR